MKNFIKRMEMMKELANKFFNTKFSLAIIFLLIFNLMLLIIDIVIIFEETNQLNEIKLIVMIINAFLLALYYSIFLNFRK